MSKEEKENIQEMDFETAFSALQENVAMLENEEMPLEQALALFERGQQLVNRCAILLEAAELRVRQLSMNDSPSNQEED
jgi:exodeoxyribonuclease VII small subunit